jgi:hypothetical protein
LTWFGLGAAALAVGIQSGRTFTLVLGVGWAVVSLARGVKALRSAGETHG